MKSILTILLFSLLIYAQEADSMDIDTASEDNATHRKETEQPEKEKKLTIRGISGRIIRGNAWCFAAVAISQM